MITNAAIRAPSDTLGTSRKLCQSQYSPAADILTVTYSEVHVHGSGVWGNQY